MFCGNCGAQVNNGMNVCSNCGAQVNKNQQFNNFQPNHTGGINQPIKTTGILVWSIIELLCVNQLFGIIALILYFVQLKPAADRGDVAETNKAKKTIKILLWIGLIMFIVILIVTLAVAVIIPMTTMSVINDNLSSTNADRIQDYLGSSIIYQENGYSITNDYYDDYEF